MGSTADIRTGELDALGKDIGKAKRNVDTRMSNYVDAQLDVIAKAAKRRAPVKSGALRRSRLLRGEEDPHA